MEKLNDVEEVAEKNSLSAYSEPTAQGFAKRQFFKKGFISGAKWGREQMMKETVKWLKETGANNLYISMFQRDMED